MAWFKAHDLPSRIDFLPRQSPERESRYPQLNDAKYQGAVQLVLPTGEIRSGEYATATALTYLPGAGWRLLGHFILLPGIRLIAQMVYKIIAKNRHRFNCDDGSCQL